VPLSFRPERRLLIDPSILRSAWLGGHGFGDTFLGDPLGTRALACRCSRERAVESVYIDRSLASLALQGRVHRGEQL
jgi:hypothetical protein